MEAGIIETILKKKKPSYRTSNNREIRVRCPYCGDSRKDASQAHFYIQTSAPYKYYCQKCTISGALNFNTLKDLGMYDSDLAVAILEENKSLRNKSGGKVTFAKKHLIIPKVKDENNPATQYFNSRYQREYSASYITDRFKAITEPIEFFNKNRIIMPNYYDFEKSIGFLSADHSHIIFRDISGTQSKRYHNLAIQETPDASKIYNISTEIDLLNDETTLVISEGVFDIIGVYENFYPKCENMIFSAACGKSYNSVIEQYIRRGFLNLKIIIYSDSDVDPGFFKNLRTQNPYIDHPITVFYNTLEKDFGVPSHRISLRRVNV